MIPQIKVPYVGAARNLFVRAMFYISLLNFIMLALTTYTVVVRDVIEIPFYMFILGLIVLVCVSLLFEYCIVLPSETAFMNKQVYEHGNPVRDDLQELKGTLQELKNILHDING